MVNEEVGKRAEDFGLNEKQKRFCEYYHMNKSAGASYKKAFGDDIGKELTMNSCYTNGSRLLKSYKIKNYLEVLRKDTKKKSMMEVSDLIDELQIIIASGSVKMSDKLRAIELLGKYHGAWLDRTEVNQSSTIEINLTGMDSVPMKVIESEPVKQIEE